MTDALIVGKFQGSAGTEYLVRKNINGKAVCSCPGYKFRKTCKHVEACAHIDVDENDLIHASEDRDLEHDQCVRSLPE